MYLSRRQHQPLSWCGDRSLYLKKKKNGTLFNNHSAFASTQFPLSSNIWISYSRSNDYDFHALLYFSTTRRAVAKFETHVRGGKQRGKLDPRAFPAFNLLPREEPQIHFIDSRSQGRERERIREPLLGNPAEESVPWDISYPSSNVTRSTRNPAVGLSHRF